MSAQSAASSPRWLFGPFSDLLLGCGALYIPIFALLAFAGPTVRETIPFDLLGLTALLVLSSPHYGATLLRVYEQRDDRRAYALFGVGATVLLALLFVAGLWVVPIGVALFTVYLTWSPWHYMGQNYGIALMFLRRRGVDVSPTAKRLLYASFVLSFVLTFIAMHSLDPEASYAPNEMTGSLYGFWSLGIPEVARDWSMAIGGGLYCVVTIGSAWLLARGAKGWRDLLPSAVLVLTQALWFSIPALLRNWEWLMDVEPIGVAHAHYTFVFIAVGHAAQYLWITAYFAKGAGTSRSNLAFYGKALMAGVALWTIPALVFAPGALGNVPYEAGLFVVLASAINIHHFILDGAIWKLRKGPVARVLLLRRGEASEPTVERPRRRWAWPVVTTLGVVSVAVSLFALHETVWGYDLRLTQDDPETPVPLEDLDRASLANERLSWVGRASTERYLRLGRTAEERGNLTLARQQYERSLALHPTRFAWIALGDLSAREERWEEARDAYLSALALKEDEVHVQFHLGVVWLRMGEYQRARRRLLAARELARVDPEVADELRAGIEQVIARNRHLLDIRQ